MPTLTITLDFSSDDGTAELFVEQGSGSWPDGSYDGSEGNPAGSVVSTLTSASTDSEKGIVQSLSDWGVPAGATVTAITNLAADVKVDLDGGSANVWPGILTQIGTDYSKAIQYRYPNSGSSSPIAWGSVGPIQNDNDQSPYALTDMLSITCEYFGDVGAGGYISYWYDNITFDIEYTVGIDVELSGSSTLPALSGSGSVTFTDVDVRLIGSAALAALTGTGGLSLDGELLLYGQTTLPPLTGSGIILMALTTDVAAPVPAGTRYTLTVDGTEYPMVSAVVERHSRYERASATIPAALVQGIIDSSPVTLEITITRVLADGSGTTDTTLFSGTVDLTATTSGDQTGTFYADGAASYPARVNRQLQGAPSYVRDSAESAAVRGQIDPDLVPGDVLRFSGVREIPVTKAVFNLTTDFQFMEASSGY